MGWNTLMPASVSDGQIADEDDFNPVYDNLNWLRYASVFESGARRTTQITGIGQLVANEQEILRTPSIVQENGYLYKVEGTVLWRPGSLSGGCDLELRLHQGSGLGGAFIPFYGSKGNIASVDYSCYFAQFFKAGSTSAQVYTLGGFQSGAVSSIDIKINTWLVISRNGDSSRMTDT